MRFQLTLAAALAAATPAAAQQAAIHPTPPPGVAAVRLTAPITVDGRLDEAVWQTPNPATGFRQSQPHQGDLSVNRTEVRFAYDDAAIYVGARMYDSLGGAGVRTRLVRRDAEADADYIQVIFDTYHDHLGRTLFQVNPSGVRTDGYGPGGTNVDLSWDPVWEASARIDSLGWTAEMRIPFSQLRYSRSVDQTWGLQIWRQSNRDNEVSSWAFWRLNETGGPPRFGHLTGLEVGASPARGEILPYVVGRSTNLPRRRYRGPLQRSAQDGRPGRRRRQDAGHVEPHAQRHHQSRLRPGRGGPGGRQPERVRDLLRRAPPLLRRGIGAVLLRRAQLLLLLQCLGAVAVLFAAHRPRAAGGRQRLRRGPLRQDPREHRHSRRGQADGTHADGLVARIPRRADRSGSCQRGAARRHPKPGARGAAHQLFRGPGGEGPARREHRHPRHGDIGRPERRRPGARPAAHQPFGTGRPLHRLVFRQAQLPAHGAARRQPGERIARGGRPDPARQRPLLPAPRPRVRIVRSDPHQSPRLCGLCALRQAGRRLALGGANQHPLARLREQRHRVPHARGLHLDGRQRAPPVHRARPVLPVAELHHRRAAAVQLRRGPHRPAGPGLRLHAAAQLLAAVHASTSTAGTAWTTR